MPRREGRLVFDGVRMPAEPIRFFNRYTQNTETEQVYGEKWLRWCYETTPGRLAVSALIKRSLFSHWYGWRMNKRISSAKVLPFILDYDLKAEEFAKRPYDYPSFNAFFYRSLKPEARPIAAGEGTAVLPADGRHLAFADVDAADGFYVKGMKFTLAELFGDESLAGEFAGGTMVISRLCPVDYHRFHFPVAGVPAAPKLINGYLYAVNPIALRKNVGYLVENKRELTLMASPAFGKVAMLEIGATCVGSIRQLFAPERPVAKGEEKGYFKFGGSCVITVFRKGTIRLSPDLLAHGAKQTEVYARMGDVLGEAVSR